MNFKKYLNILIFLSLSLSFSLSLSLSHRHIYINVHIYVCVCVCVCVCVVKKFIKKKLFKILSFTIINFVDKYLKFITVTYI